jgi:hypothetical protein
MYKQPLLTLHVAAVLSKHNRMVRFLLIFTGLTASHILRLTHIDHTSTASKLHFFNMVFTRSILFDVAQFRRIDLLYCLFLLGLFIILHYYFGVWRELMKDLKVLSLSHYKFSIANNLVWRRRRWRQIFIIVGRMFTMQRCLLVSLLSIGCFGFLLVRTEQSTEIRRLRTILRGSDLTDFKEVFGPSRSKNHVVYISMRKKGLLSLWTPSLLSSCTCHIKVYWLVLNTIICDQRLLCRCTCNVIEYRRGLFLSYLNEIVLLQYEQGVYLLGRHIFHTCSVLLHILGWLNHAREACLDHQRLLEIVLERTENCSCPVQALKQRSLKARRCPTSTTSHMPRRLIAFRVNATKVERLVKTPFGLVQDSRKNVPLQETLPKSPIEVIRFCSRWRFNWSRKWRQLSG